MGTQGIPVGLNVTSLVLMLAVEGHDPMSWKDLIDDARLLFDRVVAGPAATKARQAARKSKRGGRGRSSGRRGRRR